ncbi:MAG: Heat-inducible transcription repressor HrcA [Acidimicrobiales bacterium]|nr:Heat-inducible transcription repressor HrcA [Acidimicrobiales bacterium]
MLDERKAAILRAVVQGYIETAQPVGSAVIARAADLAVSSATIRNEMAVLERDGYLTQPHTSAGRIPTDKGYRFFVDSLTPPGLLAPAQKVQVRDFFAKAHGALEQVLHDTSQLLANLTHYAAVVIAPPAEGATVRSVQVVGLGPRTGLAVAVLANGAVEKGTIEFDHDVGEERMAAATAHLSAHLAGMTLAAGARVPATGDADTDAVVLAAGRALHRDPGADADHVYLGGASRMAAAFDAVDTVRQILGVLEQEYVVVGLLREVLDRGMSVSIGGEHGDPPLSECSVIVSPYLVEGEAAGTIGVLGPTRMNYPQAMAAVAVVSQRLGRRLSEG